MQQSDAAGQSERLTDTLADFLFDAGGTLSQLCGLTDQQLEAAYVIAYNLYNQARWEEALAAFNFLCTQHHLERRFHVGRAACLHMLKWYDAALRAYGVAHLMDVSDPQVAFHIVECLLSLQRKADALTALATVSGLTAGQSQWSELDAKARAVADLLNQTKEAACP